MADGRGVAKSTSARYVEANRINPILMKRIAVVIPAHNEGERALAVARESVRHADFAIVVDDGSDRLPSRRSGGVPASVIVLRHPVNLGKGAALKTGCAAAVRLGADIIVTLDGDGQHPPACIPGVVRHLEDGGLDIVFTARTGGDAMPLVRRWGNRAINFAAARGFGLHTADLWCGFRAFRADALPRMPWSGRDYSGEVQMALAAGKNGLRYGEYPIPTLYADAAKGVHIMHGIKLLAQMAMWRILS